MLKYTVVESTEMTYPSISHYDSASDRMDMMALRGGYATVQLLLDGLSDVHINVRVDGLEDIAPEAEIYSLVPVNVGHFSGWEIYKNRKPPFNWEPVTHVFDCVRPFDGTVDFDVIRNSNGTLPEGEMTPSTAGLYFAFPVKEDAVPGIYTGTVTVEAEGEVITVPMQIEVFAGVMPKEETVKVIQYLWEGCIWSYHNMGEGANNFETAESAEKKVPEMPTRDEMRLKYYRLIRRMRQNYINLFPPKVIELGDNKYDFDFTEARQYLNRAKAAGFSGFRFGSIGWRKDWGGEDIFVYNGLPAMSYEGYCYLTQYLPAMEKFFEEEGIMDCALLGVSDEPNGPNIVQYRAFAGLIHRIAPKLRTIDAMSYHDLHGAIDIAVPLNSEYQKHMAEYENWRSHGTELWHYTCLVPCYDAFVNRLIEYPLLCTRYLLWGNYRFNLAGYLHWALNAFQAGQNPYAESRYDHETMNAHVCLPAGDTHMIYPGINEPWMSMRLEAMREGAEDYELLRKIEKSDKALADELCQTCFRAFDDVEYNLDAFRANKRRMYEAYSAL